MKVLKILNLSFLCMAVSVSTGKADNATTANVPTEKNEPTNETSRAETDENQVKGELRTYFPEHGAGQNNLDTTILHYNGAESFNSTGFDFDGDKPSNPLESIPTGKNVTEPDPVFTSILSNSLPQAFSNQFPTSTEEDNAMNDMFSRNPNFLGKNNLFSQKLNGLSQHTSLSNLLSSKFSITDQSTKELLPQNLNSPKHGNSFNFMSSQKLNGQANSFKETLFHILQKSFESPDQDSSLNDLLSQNFNDVDQDTSFNDLFSEKINGSDKGKLFNDLSSEQNSPDQGTKTLYDLLSHKINSPNQGTILNEKFSGLGQGNSFHDLLSHQLSVFNPKQFWSPTKKQDDLYSDHDIYDFSSPQNNGIDVSILSPGDNHKLNLLYSTQMPLISGLTPCDNSNALANIVNNLLGILLSEIGESPNNVNGLIDSINTSIESNPNGILDTKLYPLLKMIERRTTSGASTLQNRLKRDLTSKIIFKEEIPRISEPDCKEAFLKLMALAYKSYIEASKLPECKMKNHIIPDNPYNPNKIIIPSFEQEHDTLSNFNTYKFDLDPTSETITDKSITDNDQNDKSQDDFLNQLMRTLQLADTNDSTSTYKSVSIQRSEDSLLPVSSSLEEQVSQKFDDQIEKELSSILGVTTKKPEIDEKPEIASINKLNSPVQYIFKSNESWFNPIKNSPEISSSAFSNASLNNDTEKTESFSKFFYPIFQNYFKIPTLRTETVSSANSQTPENTGNEFLITLRDVINNFGTKAESSTEPNKSTELKSLTLSNLSKSGEHSFPHLRSSAAEQTTQKPFDWLRWFQNESPIPNSNISDNPDTGKLQIRNNPSVGLRENPENIYVISNNEKKIKYFPGMVYSVNKPTDFYLDTDAILSSPRFRLLNPQAKTAVLKYLLAQYGKHKNIGDGNQGLLTYWLGNPKNSKLPQIVQKNNINIIVTPKQLQSPDYNPRVRNILQTILRYVKWLVKNTNRDKKKSELLKNIHSMVSQLVTNSELKKTIVVLLRIFINWASKLGVDSTMGKNINELLNYVKNELSEHNTKNLVQDSNSIVQMIIQHFRNIIRKILPNSSDQEIVLNQLDHWVHYAADNAIDLTKPENVIILLKNLNGLITKLQRPDTDFEGMSPSIPMPDFSILTDIVDFLKDMGLSAEEIVLVTSKVRQYLIDAASKGVDMTNSENYKKLAVFVKTIIKTILSKPDPTQSIFDNSLSKPYSTSSIFDTMPSSSDLILSKSGGNNSILDTNSLNLEPTYSISDTISFNPGSTHTVLKTMYSPTDTIFNTSSSNPDVSNVKILPTSYDVTGSSSEMGIPPGNSPVGRQLKPLILEVMKDHIDSLIRNHHAKSEVLRLLENYLTNATSNGIDVNTPENFNKLLGYFNSIILEFMHDSPFAYSSPEQSVSDLTNIKTLPTSYDVIGPSSETGIPTGNSSVGIQLKSLIPEVLIDHIDSLIRNNHAKSEVLRLLQNYVTNAASNGIDVNTPENFNKLLEYFNSIILEFIHDSPFAYSSPEQSVNPAIINYFSQLIFDLVPEPEQRQIVTAEVNSLIKKYVANGVNLAIEGNLNKLIWEVVNVAKSLSRLTDGSVNRLEQVTEPDSVEIVFRFRHKTLINGLQESGTSPNSYVKYTVPFDVFTKNLRNLMLKTPSLRSDPDRLEKELELKSNIIEVSPELQGLPKTDLIKILTHNGSFVDAKVSDDTRRSNLRSAADMESDAEFKEKILDLDRIVNKITTGDTDIGNTNRSSRATSEDPRTLFENVIVKNHFNPLEFNADNPFFLNLNNNTATVKEDLTRRQKLLR